MVIYDQNLQVYFWGTNLPFNTVCCCYHPVPTDDGATAYVWSRILQWHLKFKFPLSVNRNALNNCNYLTFSPNQWLQLYRVFCRHLQNKRRLLRGWFRCKYYAKVRLIIILHGAIAGQLWIRIKVVTAPYSLIFYLNRLLPVLFYQLYMIIFVWHNIP